MPPDRAESTLSTTAVFCVGAVLWLTAARAAAFLLYAVETVPSPMPAFHLEGASVHFAWRASEGLPLYPDPDKYPYALNYLTPGYFQLVGGIGRWFGGGIDRLPLAGRWITVLAGLAPAVLAAIWLLRRFGTLAAACALFAVGSAPMIGFGVMVRPDALADLAGAAAALIWLTLSADPARPQHDSPAAVQLSGMRPLRWLAVVFCGVLLAVGCLVKQSAAVYLLPPLVFTLVPVHRRHEYRWGWSIRGAVETGLLLLVAVLLAGGWLWHLVAQGETHLVRSVVSQWEVPVEGMQLAAMHFLWIRRAPELLALPLAGVLLWCTPRYRNTPLVILTAVLLVADAMACAKRGSDLNYFLNLRLPTALAAGTLCHAMLHPAVGRWRACVVLGLAAAVCLPSVFGTLRAADDARQKRIGLATPEGAARLRQRAACIDLVRRQPGQVFTDSDELAVYQGAHAGPLDMYLFRLRVEAGRLNPHELIGRLERRQLEAVVLSADAGQPHGSHFFWRLPGRLSAALHEHYELEQRQDEFFIYRPRRQDSTP